MKKSKNSNDIIDEIFENQNKNYEKDEITVILDKIIMLLEDKKGIDIKAINVEEITPITSYIVIVTANSTVHAKSMASHILGFFKSTKLTKMIKNQPDSNNPWVLIDAGDILINIFQKETRDFYNLDKLYFKGKIYK